jgi:hypothetical protein
MHGVDWNKLYLQLPSEQHVCISDVGATVAAEPVLRVMISRALWLMKYCVEFPSVSCVTFLYVATVCRYFVKVWLCLLLSISLNKYFDFLCSYLVRNGRLRM